MKTTKYWIIANAMLLGIYLYFAMPTWPTTLAQQDVPLEFRDSHESDILFLAFFPVFFAYLATNFSWLIFIFVKMRRKKLCFSLLIWLLVIASWVVIFIYDRNRSSLESPRLQEIRKEDDWQHGQALIILKT